MKTAITRLVVLLILLVNQFLVTIGWNPLPFSEDQVFEAVSGVATVAAAVWTWWVNNNVTKQAQHNEEFLKQRGRK